MRISDWSSDVCPSDLRLRVREVRGVAGTWHHHPFGARQARRHVACAVERDRRIAVAMHDQCRYRDARQLFADVVAADQRLETAHQIVGRSEEHTSELQSLMRTSYAVFCLKKKNEKHTNTTYQTAHT